MTSCPELIRDFQEELICSMCRKYFTNPMSTTCGHSFCYVCLISSWPEASTPFSCPECGFVSSLRDLRANQRLGKLAAIAKNLSPPCFQNPEENKSEINQKGHKPFYVDDWSPSPVSCSQSQEHEPHTLHSTDEFAENFKEKIQKSVNVMWRKAENVMQQMANEKLKCVLLEAEVETQKRRILSEFQKLQGFLDEEKDEYLSIVQQQLRTNMEGLSKRMKKLSHLNQELRKRILELEEECKKPDMDLLQDMKRVLNRNESVLQKEIEKFLIKKTVQPIPGITEMLLKFKVDITLDHNAACPGLIISEDLKSVRYGGTQEQEPHNSETFSAFAQVLGTQSLTSRRCYWEVEMKVPGDTGWCVGISKGPILPADFFVLMAMKGHNGYHLFAIGKQHLYSVPHVKYCQNCVSNLMVGIFLDYEKGEVSFYNVKERSLIFAFQNIYFSGPFQPFFCLSKKILTNDCSLMICP
ncbi:probable E3 ubiquitin-protein ligase TRIML1 [Vombatus ursinus]|uniref:probable E3 ubiquitin-protein ligase TRIML1 n=1 Tax=Vombatus ursinus TaxID=29139 RepID=UPI000FFD78AF|nr:probable E3 ubiquitin-protein ligase TRIML1 [Vombatus ursinus]